MGTRRTGRRMIARRGHWPGAVSGEQAGDDGGAADGPRAPDQPVPVAAPRPGGAPLLGRQAPVGVHDGAGSGTGQQPVPGLRDGWLGDFVLAAASPAAPGVRPVPWMSSPGAAGLAASPGSAVPPAGCRPRGTGWGVIPPPRTDWSLGWLVQSFPIGRNPLDPSGANGWYAIGREVTVWSRCHHRRTGVLLSWRCRGHPRPSPPSAPSHGIMACPAGVIGAELSWFAETSGVGRVSVLDKPHFAAWRLSEQLPHQLRQEEE